VVTSPWCQELLDHRLVLWRTLGHDLNIHAKVGGSDSTEQHSTCGGRVRGASTGEGGWGEPPGMRVSLPTIMLMSLVMWPMMVTRSCSAGALLSVWCVAKDRDA